MPRENIASDRVAAPAQRAGEPLPFERGSIMASALFGHRAGSGDPMVLLHGLGCSWRTWSPVLPALTMERDVLALDLPGFGSSARLPLGVLPTVPALADAVERELDAAGFARAHLVGNSLGGWIALELARRHRATSVVAISPAGAGSLEERAMVLHSAVRAYAAAKAIAPMAAILPCVVALATFIFSEVHSRPWHVHPEDAVHAVLALAGSVAFLETLEWTVGRHEAEGLADVRCPVLLAWGSEDRVLAPSQAVQFAAAIPHAELRLLPGLGHVPMPDDPALVAQTILEFTRAPRALLGGAPALPAHGFPGDVAGTEEDHLHGGRGPRPTT